MEYWSLGLLEYWKNNTESFYLCWYYHYSITPSLHYSIIPESSSIRAFLLADVLVHLIWEMIQQARYRHGRPGGKSAV